MDFQYLWLYGTIWEYLVIFEDMLSPPISLLNIYHDIRNFFPVIIYRCLSSIIFLSLSVSTYSSLEEKK